MVGRARWVGWSVSGVDVAGEAVVLAMGGCLWGSGVPVLLPLAVSPSEACPH